MSNHPRSVGLRGKIVVGAGFAVIAFIIGANALGLANYEFSRDGSDPNRPADRGLAERVCLVVSAMIPACLVVGPSALLRGRRNSLTEVEGGGRVLPLLCWNAGVALMIVLWVRWGPYTGQHYEFFEGWEFSLAWLLIWWGFAFVRLERKPGSARIVQRSPVFR